MKRINRIAGAALLGFVVVLLYLNWQTVVKWTGAHQGLASWVQALFSICAIFIAVYVVDRAHRLQQGQRKAELFEERTRFLITVYQLVALVATLAKRTFDEEVAGGTRTPLEFQALKIEIEGVVSALRRVDIGRLDDPNYLTAAVLAESHAQYLLKVVERVSVTSYSPMLDAHLLQNHANMVYQRLMKVAGVLHKNIEARGGKPKELDAPKL